MDKFFYWADIIGTIVFAISGALAGRARKLDYFGGAVLATATAVGGGTLRDIVLGRAPVFWVTNSEFLPIIVVTSLLTYFFFGRRYFPDKLIMIPDAVGISVFAVVGTMIARENGATWVTAPVFGMMTAVCGGMIRDVLSGKVPVILYRDFYAMAALIGAFFHQVLFWLEIQFSLNVSLSIFFTLCLRLAAVRYSWSLPFYTEIAEVEESYRDH